MAMARAKQREILLIKATSAGTVRDVPSQIDALLDLSKAFAEYGIPYALIGGMAVGVRSHVPRATEDVDIAARSDITRTAIKTALEGRGFECTGEFPHTLNFRHPTGEPVQVAIDPQFDEAIERADAIAISDAAVKIVRIEDLIEMKIRASEDPARRKSKALRDAADVELLRERADPEEGW